MNGYRAVGQRVCGGLGRRASRRANYLRLRPRTLAGVARDNEYGEIEYGGLPVLYR
ncbi:MAG: hypothetical protein QOC62_6165 [Mycobacterium sp.]|jgi:hypothetical protein|nr:hypothetical protein [Mycobacterium sp.]